MELTEILNYFEQNWDKIRDLAKAKGLEQGFYAITLPELSDQRYINPTLPALDTENYLGQAHIINPRLSDFIGILLSEENPTREHQTSDYFIANIIYLKKNELYYVQCTKELETITEQQILSRYTFISLTELQTPSELNLSTQEALHKIYNELHPLLEGGNENQR